MKVSRSKIDKAKKPVFISDQLSAATIKPYAKALEFFHKRKLKEAHKAFKQFLSKHETEHPEITERANLYMAICELKLHPPSYAYKSFDDFFYGGIFEVNAANCDTAIEYFNKALKMQPKNDHVLYLLASTYALKKDVDNAIQYLNEAIAIRDFNRIQAMIDTDFDDIRGHEAFKSLIS